MFFKPTSVLSHHFSNSLHFLLQQISQFLCVNILGVTQIFKKLLFFFFQTKLCKLDKINVLYYTQHPLPLSLKEELDNVKGLILFWDNFSGVIQASTDRSAHIFPYPILLGWLLLEKFYWAHPLFHF